MHAHTTISTGFDECMRAFDLKQDSHLQWTCDHSRVYWEEFVRCQVRTNETYWEARRQFGVRNRDVLVNAHGGGWMIFHLAIFQIHFVFC